MEDPLIVTPSVMAAAELLALNVIGHVPEPLIGPTLAVKPAGKPVGDKVTLLGLRPPDGVIVIVLEPVPPWARVKVLGDEERLKFGVAAAIEAFTVYVAWYAPLAPVELVASPLK